MGGTAEFGWGPEDPVEEGQLELRGVVFTESSGGSPLGESYVSPDNSDLKFCVTNDRGYPSICHGGVIIEISGTEVFSTLPVPVVPVQAKILNIAIGSR